MNKYAIQMGGIFVLIEIIAHSRHEVLLLKLRHFDSNVFINIAIYSFLARRISERGVCTGKNQNKA